jgi:PBP1b-binding outer membrane lipoprotein LpoB
MKKIKLIVISFLVLISCNKVKSWDCTIESTTTGVNSVPSLNTTKTSVVHFSGTKKEAKKYEEDNTKVIDVAGLSLPEDSDAKISFVTTCSKK